MTDEVHAAALSAVFDKIKEVDAPVLMHVGNPIGVQLYADGVTNLATIVATHSKVRLAHAHYAGTSNDQRIEVWLLGIVATSPVFSPENFYVEVSACLKFFKDAPLAKRELIV
ncbi:MAG: hypothetical protein BZY80_06170 [SAR202 cluster bacterium Io17-Chloro-G2]|nr:MAG: hypothetical protein BZY80_06170 [SAR202 cluster bacterium Io17-Chloro-G2]